MKRFPSPRRQVHLHNAKKRAASDGLEQRKRLRVRRSNTQKHTKETEKRRMGESNKWWGQRGNDHWSRKNLHNGAARENCKATGDQHQLKVSSSEKTSRQINRNRWWWSSSIFRPSTFLHFKLLLQHSIKVKTFDRSSTQSISFCDLNKRRSVFKKYFWWSVNYFKSN